MAALGSPAAEGLVAKGAFPGALMERHRSRALRPPDERDWQRAGLSERALQSSDARTNHLKGFRATIDRRPARGGGHAFISRLPGGEHLPGAESRSGGGCLATSGG